LYEKTLQFTKTEIEAKYYADGEDAFAMKKYLDEFWEVILQMLILFKIEIFKEKGRETAKISIFMETENGDGGKHEENVDRIHRISSSA
jgi:hypothetical protein